MAHSLLRGSFLRLILIIQMGYGILLAQTGFDGDRAFTFLEKQVAFGPRTPNSTGARETQAWILQTLSPLADEVRLQSFEQANPYAADTLYLSNIIARFQPDLTRRVLLCAHWDTRPRADQDPDDPEMPIPGANDGASGVAVLLEIAHQLKEQPVRIGVDLVFFDGEDFGREGHLQDYLMGSRYHAQHPLTPPAQEVILLDMVGDAELEILIDPVSYNAAPHLVDAIWDIAAELGYSEFQRRAGSPMYDDHVPFINAGYPAIDIIDFNYPNRDQNYWHTLADTPDKCSSESLEIVGDTILTWVYRQ